MLQSEMLLDFQAILELCFRLLMSHIKSKPINNLNLNSKKVIFPLCRTKAHTFSFSFFYSRDPGVLHAILASCKSL